jgi:hypothetical protein
MMCVLNDFMHKNMLEYKRFILFWFYSYLQHNEFTGSVILLADLPLSSLNIENNSFSGYVPGTFESIPELRYSVLLNNPRFFP